MLVRERDGRAREVELAFRALAELDPNGRAFRRPLPWAQLLAETGAERDSIEAVVRRFAAEDCGFLGRPAPDEPLNAETIVDIAHEALLRRWTRLCGSDLKAGWLQQEAQDAATYEAMVKSVPAGLSVRQLLKYRAWWKHFRPTPAWTNRYRGNRSQVELYLQRKWRRFLVTLFSAVLFIIGVAATSFWYFSERAKLVSQVEVLTSANAYLDQANTNLHAQIKQLDQENAWLKGQLGFSQEDIQPRRFSLWRAVLDFAEASPAAFWTVLGALGTCAAAAVATLTVRVLAARRMTNAVTQSGSQSGVKETAAGLHENAPQQLRSVQMKLPGLPHGGAYAVFPNSPEGYRSEAWDETAKPLFEVAVSHAQARVTWYDHAAGRYAKNARRIRRGSLMLFTLGTLAPIVAILLVHLVPFLGNRTEEIAQLPLTEVGYVLLALAGALVIFDQFFGYSSSWIRFRQSQARLEVMLADLRFSWAGLMSKLGTNGELAHRTECSVLLHDFVVAVEQLAEAETREWATNFRSQIDTFDRNPDLKVKTTETRHLMHSPGNNPEKPSLAKI
jgi:cell division protein FtsB